MVDSPWGPLAVSDSHVHFFSHKFFSALASQRAGLTVEGIGSTLEWRMPDAAPEHLAAEWAGELGRAGVDSAAMIASIPGDEESVEHAAPAFPGRFHALAMVNSLAA